MQHQNYTCTKCGNRAFDTDTISTTGTGLSRFFDLQNRRFTAVSCRNCGYTEFYKGDKASTISTIFDFFTS
ncbi:hypothetical protein BXY85_2856 [Roseivirga pacifica]|uniref:GTP-binding protein n=1 Tax=Roseivirga pacifica TaxID=1267423 RepID=A0A1I0R0G2_9BACT|nr:zinc ribbon domain-containing protein [Roseivirga pacifica]MCO6357505.1 GTP-binding protein [Roseivirga pacifica]MCO6367730.1 GTP-binding protein [Roseivirga pacifica]MCO6369738.1 GTP-binding protein [Roseivirga pacifica]MCO6373592.1 GTP-binding protein [Roseivirga pacifica]MCO6377103.1 GTP-binding protein [Roseivirga pacifica]